MSDATVADAARSELYREAARAAVAELDEIETTTMALEARIVRLRTRAKTLTSLLDVIGELEPDAARAPGPFAPPLAADAPTEPDLPRRRRLRERPEPATAPDSPAPQRAADFWTVPVNGVAPEVDGVLQPLGDGRHAGRTNGASFAPVPADVDAWG